LGGIAALTGTFPHEQIGEIMSDHHLIVVPSLWYESTPLVLCSARQCAGAARSCAQKRPIGPAFRGTPIVRPPTRPTSPWLSGRESAALPRRVGGVSRSGESWSRTRPRRAGAAPPGGSMLVACRQDTVPVTASPKDRSSPRNGAVRWAVSGSRGDHEAIPGAGVSRTKVVCAWWERGDRPALMEERDRSTSPPSHMASVPAIWPTFSARCSRVHVQAGR
jgi:hypothetical protein